MKHYTYVDNSNLYIGGQMLSAVQNHMAIDIWEAQREQIYDYTWQMDYYRLYSFLAGANEHEIGCVKLWGSSPPREPFWSRLTRIGFEVEVFERSIIGREKKVDVALTYNLTKDAYSEIDRRIDEIVLVAGDTDYLPLVQGLVRNGFTVTLLFWEQAADELKAAATSFVSLDPRLQFLTKTESSRRIDGSVT
ncbi:MAG: hypothetical protein QOE70_6310 [Chthoniobacter sp.]|jgi:uncharacterized LabA/DUF88 family protein|nr:hypothetical protein [Chthoniobacter sp.]